jgi:IS5 family transposase
MITIRCVSQPRFADGFIEEAVGELWEPWMREADRILEDEELLNSVYEALLRRRPNSRTRGRLGIPAEIVIRMLLLKHIQQLEFRRIGARSTTEPVVSGVHARGRRQSA